ncbi:PREDICTED: centromere protein S isoform X1 [Hipposideros armiger]|uniref:Centromere protein S n=1 Tax=Hipposideros armiger TaxID=186990 RepID=A0A8B7R3K5_HIPAR|nr:PREDICTED: centromere protein S isoform X1 [Hipposideros armiger]
MRSQWILQDITEVGAVWNLPERNVAEQRCPPTHLLSQRWRLRPWLGSVSTRGKAGAGPEQTGRARASQGGRRGRAGGRVELRALSLRAARRREPRRENLTAPCRSPSLSARAPAWIGRRDGGRGGGRRAAAILLSTENFAKDLEMFARHAKRSTINTEDVKLLARRSNSLLRYITEKNEEIAQGNQERKAKKKKKLEDENNSVEPAEADVEESET